MRFTNNMRNYEPLIIPLNKPIEELTKKEAKVYFDWFIAHIDERAEYLREKVSVGLNISIELLDFSFESLKYIWKWFLNVAEISKKPRYILNRLRHEKKEQLQTPDIFDDEKELNGHTKSLQKNMYM